MTQVILKIVINPMGIPVNKLKNIANALNVLATLSTHTHTHSHASNFKCFASSGPICTKSFYWLFNGFNEWDTMAYLPSNHDRP